MAIIPLILNYKFRAVFKFDESNRLIVSGTGADVTLFKGQFGPDDKGFGYVKIQVDIQIDTQIESIQTVLLHRIFIWDFMRLKMCAYNFFG